jgi:hypothetical protein
LKNSMLLCVCGRMKQRRRNGEVYGGVDVSLDTEVAGNRPIAPLTCLLTALLVVSDVVYWCCGKQQRGSLSPSSILPLSTSPQSTASHTTRLEDKQVSTVVAYPLRPIRW